MTLGDKTAYSAKEKCQLFAEKFTSVFSNETLPDAEISAAAGRVPLGQPFITPEIGDDDILAALRKLKSSHTPGPDGIPSIFLKKCAAGLAKPLGHIFRLSLSSGCFPSLWKAAFMFPVYKKGDKTDVNNYRGISALCATSKLFELVVMKYITFHCKSYIPDDQHGYMPKRSTTTNLLSLTSFISDCFADGVQTDAIYTDLSAAFDKINHDIAVAKLERLGFNGTFLDWFRSYLSNRSLNVMIGDQFSTCFAATSGIPQGSHLGPLVFLLYFNDINLELNCPRLSYADDLKLFNRITGTADARLLQTQLDTFSSWCTTNRMVLNADKCAVISFARKEVPLHFDYELFGTKIDRVKSIKDLGVILDDKLEFTQHVSAIVGKASRQLGFLFRAAKNFNNIECLKTLYCSLVRTVLEYCSAVWSPYYLNGSARIEAVQRRFVRYALRRLPWRNPFRLPSYESRCRLLQLDTLQVRRDATRALFVADVLTSRIDCPFLLANINVRAPLRVLRTHTFLAVPFRRSLHGSNLALVGLQRNFNYVSTVFDFNVSRDVLKRNFFNVFRN